MTCCGGGISQPIQLFLESNVFQPTLTPRRAGTSVFVASGAQWMRVNDIITMSGSMIVSHDPSVDPSGFGFLSVELPYPMVYDAYVAGTVAGTTGLESPEVSSGYGIVLGGPGEGFTDTEVVLRWITNSVAVIPMAYHFTYQAVLPTIEEE